MGAMAAAAGHPRRRRGNVLFSMSSATDKRSAGRETGLGRRGVSRKKGEMRGSEPRPRSPDLRAAPSEPHTGGWALGARWSEPRARSSEAPARSLVGERRGSWTRACGSPGSAGSSTGATRSPDLRLSPSTLRTSLMPPRFSGRTHPPSPFTHPPHALRSRQTCE